jgi:hypothetical protein
MRNTRSPQSPTSNIPPGRYANESPDAFNGIIWFVDMRRTFSRLAKITIATAFLLAGCASGQTVTPTLVPPTSILPTSTPSAPITPTLRPTATHITLSYADPFQELVATIEASDPKYSTYAPDSAAYTAFPQAVKQLAAMNAPDNNGASMLAYALTFPRDDSYLAAQALISLGPDWTMTTAPILFDGLVDMRPRVRLYAVLALGTVGKQGSCAVGNIAPLLWDSDASVRSAATHALANLTGKDLLPSGLAFTPQPFSDEPVPADTPAGSISGPARQWWNEQGANINWHPSYDLCDP